MLYNIYLTIRAVSEQTVSCFGIIICNLTRREKKKAKDVSYLPVLSDGSDLHGQVKLTSVLQVRVTESVSQSRQCVVTVDALKTKPHRVGSDPFSGAFGSSDAGAKYRNTLAWSRDMFSPPPPRPPASQWNGVK